MDDESVSSSEFSELELKFEWVGETGSIGYHDSSRLSVVLAPGDEW
jgi:hypothetical protein